MAGGLGLIYILYECKRGRQREERDILNIIRLRFYTYIN